MIPQWGLVLGCLLFVACNPKSQGQQLSSSASAPQETTSPVAEGTSAEEVRAIAVSSYLFGYPLVTMEMTRRVMTNVQKAGATRAPMGEFARLRKYPDAQFRDVTAPNADTLYVLGWMSVEKEPWVLSIPASEGRYNLFPLLDGYTEVFEVPGSRTTGNAAQNYLISTAEWEGEVPSGVTHYTSPTDLVWVLGRVYCTGTDEDYQKAHQYQDGVTIVPLSSYGKEYQAPEARVDASIDMKRAVRDQVNALSAQEFFTLMTQLMVKNPPKTEDHGMLETMSRIGIRPGSFNWATYLPEEKKLLSGAPAAALAKLLAHKKSGVQVQNGWVLTKETGRYGVDYLQRAFVTYVGLGANRPQDAIYPFSEVDSSGQPYNGQYQYVLHFEPGELPPAKAFWSLTMYDQDYFFSENQLNRYTLSSRDSLKKNEDGSVDLYFQHQSPGTEKESNWLPAPSEQFILMLRLYWPNQTPPSLLDDSWVLPPVKKVLSSP
ncbi:MAG: DUF1254 domain-containing protein [Polyangiaceae bacterium]|nr:DUF1254 domain-containing protein [Polyangiaceae bacterium]